MAVGRDGRPPGLPDRDQRCDARPAATRRVFQAPRRADRTQTERSDELGQEVGLLLPTHKQKPESGQLPKTPSGNRRGALPSMDGRNARISPFQPARASNTTSAQSDGYNSEVSSV